MDREQFILKLILLGASKNKTYAPYAPYDWYELNNTIWIGINEHYIKYLGKRYPVKAGDDVLTYVLRRMDRQSALRSLHG